MENLLRKYPLINIVKGSTLKTIKSLINNFNVADKIQKKVVVKRICVPIDNFQYYCSYNNLKVVLNEFIIGKIRFCFGYYSITELVNNVRSFLLDIVPLHKSYYSINEIIYSTDVEVFNYRSIGTPSTLKFLN
jgi:hypothetical protein